MPGRMLRPSDTRLPAAVRLLGLGGVLPQALAVALVVLVEPWRFAAFAGGFAYAAAIFSFLGGMWWGQALAFRRASFPTYLVAVLPPLLAVALFLPWVLGWDWPGPSLFWLGLMIAASPMVDVRLGLTDRAFLGLRWQLSLLLGILTLALGLLAMFYA